MGARIESGSGWLEVRRGRWPLAPLDLDCNPLPDAAMTLAALALFADGPSTLRNIASWRVKETDRLAAMASELRKVGADVEEGPDFLRITPPQAWRAASIATYDDHRMAMCDVAGRVQSARRRHGSGAHPRPALRRQDLARLLRSPVLGRAGTARGGSGADDRRAHRLRQGHAGERGRRTPWATGCSIPARSTGRWRSPRSTPASPPRTSPALAALAAALELRFDGDRCHLGGRDVTDSLRREEVGAMASKISAWPAVRAAVLEVQLAFRDVPGLVADGRDMGSVVFPDAELKVFLTAGAAERAERRYKQLISKGIPAKLDSLRAELEARDARDRNRSASPLVPAEGAFMLDNSALSIEASVDAVLEAWQERRPFDRTSV